MKALRPNEIFKINGELNKRKFKDRAVIRPNDDATRETACEEELEIVTSIGPNKRQKTDTGQFHEAAYRCSYKPDERSMNPFKSI